MPPPAADEIAPVLVTVESAPTATMPDWSDVMSPAFETDVPPFETTTIPLSLMEVMPPELLTAADVVPEAESPAEPAVTVPAFVIDAPPSSAVA